MSSRFEEMQGEVGELMQGVNRYNPFNTACLEEYLEAQAAEGEYDAEANLTLLKLYQLNPDKHKAPVVVKVLLKALMSLPHSDMTLCKSLIDAQHLENPEIKQVGELGEALEKCQFRRVWELLAETQMAELVRPFHGFTDAVKAFACHTVAMTYQNIAETTLEVILGFPKEKELAAIYAEHGWVKGSDGFVFIANQEANVKSKNIQEKIELANLTDILAVAGQRG